jgi:hypothetical protein
LRKINGVIDRALRLGIIQGKNSGRSETPLRRNIGSILKLFGVDYFNGRRLLATEKFGI